MNKSEYCFHALPDSGGPARWSRKIIVLFAAVGVSLLARVLYENRLRYQRMGFSFYFDWWSQFNHGIDTWRHGCNYTPLFIVLFAPLAHLDQQVAYWIWQSIQLVALVVALGVSLGELQDNVAAKSAAALGVLVVLSPYLLFGTLYEAEPTALLLALLVGAWALGRRRRSALAGLMLAAAALLKVYPAVAGGYFLFRRRYGVIIWGAAWSIVGVAASGTALWRESLFSGAMPYFNAPDWARDDRALSFLLNAYSAVEVLKLPVAQQAAWAVAIYVLLALGVMAVGGWVTARARDDVEVEGVCFSLWLIAALLVSPIAWNHELTLTLPLYIFTAAYLVQHRKIFPTTALVLLSLATLGFAVPYYSTQVRRPHVYFISLLIQYAAMLMIVRSWSALEHNSNRVLRAEQNLG